MSTGQVIHSTARTALTLVLAFSLLLVFGAPAGAVGACDAGAVCVYAKVNLDPSGSHMEAQGSNGRWALQFPGITNNERSVFNNGQTGMSVNVYDWNWYLGGTKYCVERGDAWNLGGVGLDGQSHQWVWNGTNCL